MSERRIPAMIWRVGAVAIATPFVSIWLAVRYDLFEFERRADAIGQRFAHWVGYSND